MKKALAMAMSTCLLATSLVGCGSNESKQPEASSTPAPSTEAAASPEASAEAADPSAVSGTLRFNWWGGDDRHTATLEAVKAFEAKYPNIKVESEYGGWDGHAEKITTQMTGGTAADVLQVNYDWLSKFSPDGTGFLDLESMGSYLDLSTFSEDVLTFGRRKGILNAIPVSTTGRSMYFNKTTFDKVGAELPKTWDDLLALGEKFSAQGLYPYDLDTGSGFPGWYNSIVYMQQKTGRLFINEDGTLGFTQEDIKEGLDFYKSLEDAKVIRTQEQRSNEAGTTPLYQTPSWLDGKVAGVLEWSSSIGKFESALEEKGQELVLGNLLTLDGAQSTGWFMKPSLLFAINKDTKSPEAAAVLLNYILNDPEAAVILGTTRGIPASSAAKEALQAAGELEGLAYEGTKQIEDCQPIIMSPYLENSIMKEIYKEAVEAVSYGTATTEEAAATMYEELVDTLESIAQ
ncbi:extracellular solute-binding protein [Cellulosilyticum sp. ST5]|uniref:ABC transporter substrate-binding protein n=1 Tax=unclassified Cellulosilyticum TaxID=2643091 RepID=UPI000F8E710D|nr:ABC transporter substrate-binding protein [Cellulosilyticum sp. WCF-2]QEH68467.1 extracellular solute-binding protein [Cellulosilyticum sp. WCF-2]